MVSWVYLGLKLFFAAMVWKPLQRYMYNTKVNRYNTGICMLAVATGSLATGSFEGCYKLTSKSSLIARRLTNDDGALPPADQSARRKSIQIAHTGRQLHCVAKRASQQDWHETSMLSKFEVWFGALFF